MPSRCGGRCGEGTEVSGEEHILVVDDDSDVRLVLTEMLQGYGYRVSGVADGASMREFLQGTDPVDAIVLDMLMPGENGKALAFYAEELGLPVVLISGSLEAMDFAAENHLKLLGKPFRAQDLVNAVIEAIASGEAGPQSEDSN
jgi:two-component system, OmpR family, response regulator